MPIILRCTCGKKLQVRDEFLGRKVRCPACKAVLAADTPAGEETPVVALVAPPLPPPLPSQVEPPVVTAAPAPRREALFWTFPGSFKTEIMAVTDDAFWFANLSSSALQEAEDALADGEHPQDALGKKAVCIPFDAVSAIESNRKKNSFTIAYKEGKEAKSKVLNAAAKKQRDRIFKDLKNHLGWERDTNHYTQGDAAKGPIIGIAVTVLCTIGLAVLSHLAHGWGPARVGGGGRARALAALYNLLRDMGPLWTCVAGLVVVLGFLAWLVIRVQDPPIVMTLKPAADVR